MLEILDGGKIKAVAPGTASVTVRETADPAGKAPAEDERNVTVIPNQTAVLEVYPSDPLWERNGAVSYTHLVFRLQSGGFTQAAGDGEKH